MFLVRQGNLASAYLKRSILDSFAVINGDAFSYLLVKVPCPILLNGH